MASSASLATRTSQPTSLIEEALLIDSRKRLSLSTTRILTAFLAFEVIAWYLWGYEMLQWEDHPNIVYRTFLGE